MDSEKEALRNSYEVLIFTFIRNAVQFVSVTKQVNTYLQYLLKLSSHKYFQFKTFLLTSVSICMDYMYEEYVSMHYHRPFFLHA